MARKTTDAVSQYLAEIGRRGGSAKVPKGLSKATPERRKEIARKAAKVRWAKRKKEGSEK